MTDAQPCQPLQNELESLRSENKRLVAENEQLQYEQRQREAQQCAKRLRSVRNGAPGYDAASHAVEFSHRRQQEWGGGGSKLFAQIQQAKLQRANWDGVPMLKSPFDALILVELLRIVRPATILELGALAGGSALYLADQAEALGLPTRVVSLDVDLRKLHPAARRASLSQRLTFMEADTAELGRTLTDDFLATLQRPLVVLEDAHENLEAALAFFDAVLQEGDYLVVEDTIDAEKMGALSAFLGSQPAGRYAVDTYFADHWGPNMTWNPDGYLRRMQ